MNKWLVWLFLLSMAAGVALVAYAPTWTGFHDKTLWDWMSLILVPAVIAIGGAWLKTRQERIAREVETRRRNEERALQQDRLSENALQGYFDRMTELMLREHLRESKPGDDLQSVARARTLTVLSQLDARRKGVLIRFLVEAGLIRKSRRVIRLQDADMRNADLRGATLVVRGNSTGNCSGTKENQEGVSFRKVDLRKANLRGAKLIMSDLWGAKFAEADLSDANLGSSNLRGANLKNARLERTKLGGADLSRAKLSNARLCGARFGDADLAKADLTGADLAGADLRGVKNLTQEQLESAVGDSNVKLPTYGFMPDAWRRQQIAQVKSGNS